jgi:hypothetical protein
MGGRQGSKGSLRAKGEIPRADERKWKVKLAHNSGNNCISVFFCIITSFFPHGSSSTEAVETQAR